MIKVAHALGEDWAQVAKTCTDDLMRTSEAFNLGFLYVTAPLSDDLPSILTYLRQKTGIEHWTGSVGLGICANAGDEQQEGGEYFHIPAAAVMAMAKRGRFLASFTAIRRTPKRRYSLKSWRRKQTGFSLAG